MKRRARLAAIAVVVVLALLGPVPAGAAPTTSPVQTWLSAPLLRIAHRGGSADWPEGSPLAYARATDWNPQLALEFPARRTADGVWVASEDASTGRVFGTDLVIANSTWARLSTLRSLAGDQPMSRLQQDVLDTVPRNRILFVDDKDDAHVDELLDLLGRYGGPRRTVFKAFWQSRSPVEARARGYTTWGYYYPGTGMAQFDATQGRFDLLGIQWSAPTSDYRRMLATGKRVIAHVVATQTQADSALAAGATGLMVSGVREVVPRA